MHSGELTGVTTVTFNADGPVIVLDRVVPDWTPPYCVHGQTPCVVCERWVLLGHASHDVVVSGEAMPICRQCATERLPAGSVPFRQVNDHLRADGPH